MAAPPPATAPRLSGAVTARAKWASFQRARAGARHRAGFRAGTPSLPRDCMGV